ncbi:MAG: hypothetical protein M1812_004320 [Candelaria pacifica]|nr:MAG: hypothetical protein M1812_004320 [Candelaria pacifica]
MRSLQDRLRSFLHPRKPLPDLTNVSYSSSTNANSRLLCLPAELRLQIYGYVFGEAQVFHLFSVRDRDQPSRRHTKPVAARIAHIRCRLPNFVGDSDCAPVCCEEYHSPFHDHCACTRGAGNHYVEEDVAVSSRDYAFPGVSDGNLALLRTCRQIYREALSYPYSNNAFALKDIRHLPPFVAGLPVLQAKAIQRLELTWAMSYGFSCGQITSDVCPPLRRYAWWDEFWDVVAIRLSLRELSICMSGAFFGLLLDGREPVELDYEARWVKPMLQVRGLRKFWFFLKASSDMESYRSQNRKKDVESFITALRGRMVEGGAKPAQSLSSIQ